MQTSRVHASAYKCVCVLCGYMQVLHVHVCDCMVLYGYIHHACMHESTCKCFVGCVGICKYHVCMHESACKCFVGCVGICKYHVCMHVSACKCVCVVWVHASIMYACM